ncbi:LemA family protein [Allosphingosinicella sp.]|jgi:LemA protein|uniref:LemA family protein n=1 Tax=Allosphingosinicella sp. TaxID=2823234 RepID=UPI002F1B0D14
MTRTRLLAVFAPILVLISACGINSVPTAEENAKARWADVQSDYQRRADLIPNLVETVRAASAQERNVLREVTEARASASRIQVTGEQLTDPAAMARFAEAQSRITISLQRLQEAYPELRSNQNYETLLHQLEGTENRVARSRERYNQAVQEYNTLIRTFPSSIGASVIHGAEAMVPYQADAEAQRAPRVDFGNGS